MYNYQQLDPKWVMVALLVEKRLALMCFCGKGQKVVNKIVIKLFMNYLWGIKCFLWESRYKMYIVITVGHLGSFVKF